MISRITKYFIEADVIKGGLSDNKTLQDIANHHKVSLDSISKQVKKGIPVEKEHTNSDEKALEIVKDHLWEMPNYYDKLETIEKK